MWFWERCKTNKKDIQNNWVYLCFRMCLLCGFFLLVDQPNHFWISFLFHFPLPLVQQILSNNEQWLAVVVFLSSLCISLGFHNLCTNIIRNLNNLDSSLCPRLESLISHLPVVAWLSTKEVVPILFAYILWLLTHTNNIFQIFFLRSKKHVLQPKVWEEGKKIQPKISSKIKEINRALFLIV